MRSIKLWLLSCITLGMFTTGNAHINPELHKKTGGTSSSDASGISYRENCDNAVARVDMAINNVRARLTTGGDVWWDGTNGQYIVPKVEPGSGIDPVSSIFAGAVWIGGLDPTGETLKIAAQTYGRSSGSFDFWPGPLVPDGPDVGTVEQQTCSDWDRFFTVRAKNIDLHKALFEEAKALGIPYDESSIPEDVKGWPAKGNPYFFDIHEFDLPNTSQGLAGFHDYDDDGNYDPLQGDYPIIEIRGCPNLYYGDEMTFWIYNDAGNSHAETGSADRLQMEVQVQAFAYSTSDEINNMTFQRYKLINRAVESLDSTYFAMWMDPDLGCHTDDYVGCDTLRSLAYVYNSDGVDGTTPGSCNCDGGAPTYCEEIPILGLDYFRGPLDENFNEIGMSSFTYYNNGSVGGNPPGTTDPQTADEYYNYMRGLWRDGSPFQYGGDAYQEPGAESIKYAFTEAPNNPSGWSMYQEDLPIGDRRTVQASGPFRLDPGAVNELIIGAVWVPNQSYPGPSIKKLQEADDIAQKLFDECFKIPNGPDAPDVDFIELDQEIVMILSNNENPNISNNANEAYQETGLDIPAGVLDSLYFFEGYRIFQVSGPGIDLSKENRNNKEKVRIYAEVNAKNGVAQLFNWRGLGEDETPIATGGFQAEAQLDFPTIDDGVRHTFQIKEDLFSKGDGRLINHKKYYYIVVAYGYNNYEAFDPVGPTGQRKPYFEGRRNIGPTADGKPYTVIPRPITDRVLNAGFGDGAVITRIDGAGTGTNFLDLSDETRAAIEKNIVDGTATTDAELTYSAGRGPIDILVYNPLDVKDGEFELTFTDENMGNNVLDTVVNWQLTNLTDPSAPVILSDTSINKLNEQIIKEFGFSIAIGQVANVGSEPEVDPLNGFIGYEEEYANGEEAVKWLAGVPEGVVPGIGAVDQNLFDYVQNAPGQENSDADPEQVFSQVGPGYFVPYYLCNYLGNQGTAVEDVITPAWTAASPTGPNIVHGQAGMENLNNVDIVFTADKSLWSRCIIVETANTWLVESGEQTANHTGLDSSPVYNKSMDAKSMRSVTKEDSDGDGFPDVDPNVVVGAYDEFGYGWFPGYAVDVETGQRLNIFFGENSVYDGSKDSLSYESAPTGNDMMFNPTSQFFLGTGGFPTVYNYMAGAHHFVYVTNEPYDGCSSAEAKKMEAGLSLLQKIAFIKKVTWAGFLMPRQGENMLSYKDGLIPEDVRVKLRVNDNYQVKVGTNDFNGYPTYRFKLEGLQADELDDEGVETALDLINVVPNPYYGFSDYENSQFDTNIKITNLPPKCVITIYSLDGKFIRQYNRDEVGTNAKGAAINRNQVNPDVLWDLKNNKGIPVASGVYLIHVAAEGLGERTLKWFGVNRQFDPTGL